MTRPPAAAGGHRVVAAQRRPGPATPATARRLSRGGRRNRPTLPFVDAVLRPAWSAGTRSSSCGSEIARVLRPGGTYLSQQIGAGLQPRADRLLHGAAASHRARRSAASARAGAEEAGLEIVNLRECARCRWSSSTSVPSSTSCARCAGPCPASRVDAYGGPAASSARADRGARLLRVHGPAVSRRGAPPGLSRHADARTRRTPPAVTDRRAVSWPGSPSSCCSRGCAAAA